MCVKDARSPFADGCLVTCLQVAPLTGTPSRPEAYWWQRGRRGTGALAPDTITRGLDFSTPVYGALEGGGEGFLTGLHRRMDADDTAEVRNDYLERESKAVDIEDNWRTAQSTYAAAYVDALQSTRKGQDNGADISAKKSAVHYLDDLSSELELAHHEMDLLCQQRDRCTVYEESSVLTDKICNLHIRIDRLTEIAKKKEHISKYGLDGAGRPAKRPLDVLKPEEMLDMDTKDIEVLWEWCVRVSLCNANNQWVTAEDQKRGIMAGLSPAGQREVRLQEAIVGNLSPDGVYMFFLYRWKGVNGYTQGDAREKFYSTSRSTFPSYTAYNQRLVFLGRLSKVTPTDMLTRFISGLSPQDMLEAENHLNSRPRVHAMESMNILTLYLTRRSMVYGQSPPKLVNAISVKTDVPTPTLEGAGASGTAATDAKLQTLERAVNALERAQAIPPNTSGCFNCGESGHLARSCPNPPRNSREKDTCYNCQQLGHHAGDCTNPRVPRDFKCYGCGREGHLNRDCTATTHVDPTKELYKYRPPGERTGNKRYRDGGSEQALNGGQRPRHF